MRFLSWSQKIADIRLTQPIYQECLSDMLQERSRGGRRLVAKQEFMITQPSKTGTVSKSKFMKCLRCDSENTYKSDLRYNCC